MFFITQILLPKTNNFGQQFAAKHYRPFHTRMIHRFGGWTRKGYAEGAWLSPSGQLYTEGHWVYEIASQRRPRRFWHEEKARLKVEFDQEEIWMMQFEGRRI
jgi:hypothetical protein